MLRSLNDLKDYAISATDGTIGEVKNFYFDDERWIIRYFIVETGNWLSNRKVLISPISIDQPNWTDKVLPVSLTKERVKNSPDIDTEQPVSRQHEMLYLGHYGYPMYWGGDGLWGNGSYPGMLMTGDFALASPAVQQGADIIYARAEATRHLDDDIHLRSFNAVLGYHIVATDGEIGHVKGMLVDDETWAVRYLIVDTSNWWLGHQVLIAPPWIQDVSWSDSTVAISLTRQAVQDAPQYDAALPLDRSLEADLYEHYGRPSYWQIKSLGLVRK
jgi:uncharacterized protein YrrD